MQHVIPVRVKFHLSFFGPPSNYFNPCHTVRETSQCFKLFLCQILNFLQFSDDFHFSISYSCFPHYDPRVQVLFRFGTHYNKTLSWLSLLHQKYDLPSLCAPAISHLNLPSFRKALLCHSIQFYGYTGVQLVWIYIPLSRVTFTWLAQCWGTLLLNLWNSMSFCTISQMVYCNWAK